MNIKIIYGKGIKELDENEERIFNKLLNEYSKKIERMLKNVNLVEAYIKDYSKEGKSKKFSIHIKIISNTRNFDTFASDWDFARTLHKAFSKMMNKIEHEFHVSNQHDNFRKFQNKRKRK